MRRRRNITDNLGCHGQKFAGRGEWRFSLQAASAGDKTITQLTQPDSGKNGSELEYTKLHPSFEMSSKLPKSGVCEIWTDSTESPTWSGMKIRIYQSETPSQWDDPSCREWVGRWGKNHPFRGTIRNWKNTICIVCVGEHVWHWPHSISYGKNLLPMPHHYVVFLLLTFSINYSVSHDVN